MADNPIIRHALPSDIPAIVDFVLAGRSDMFSEVPSRLHTPKTKRELATFEQDYLDDPNGAFLTATVDGILVATVGYVAYDDRFPQLDFDGQRVVEVVKLYVDPKWRRTGLATRIFASLEEEAWRTGIRHLYLHTHPFLPGSVCFWEQQGFRVLCVDKDPVWRTTHMRKALSDQERNDP